MWPTTLFQNFGKKKTKIQLKEPLVMPGGICGSKCKPHDMTLVVVKGGEFGDRVFRMCLRCKHKTEH